MSVVAEQDIPSDLFTDLLERCLEVEAQWFEPMDNVDVLLQFYQWQMQAEQLLDSEFYQGRLQRVDKPQLDAVLQLLFMEWGLSGHAQPVPTSLLNSIGYALAFRTGDSVSLSIIIRSLLARLGWAVEVLLYQDDLYVEVQFNSQESYLVEPLTGNLSWVLRPENAAPGEQDEDQFEYLDEESLLKLFVSKQKWAFIEEDRFEQALTCVNVLMELSPDDGLEYRDRGFVLQKLDCEHLAWQDFNEFIRRCPHDPAAQLLKMQWDDTAQPEQSVIH